jgi:hypothetical protein
VFLVPLQGADAANFYQLVNLLGMTKATTPYIFFLSNDLCQYGLANATARASLPSSICISPYVDPVAFGKLQSAYNASNLLPQLQQTLFQGGFTGVYTCNLTTLSTYSAFALDSGSVIIDVVNRAVSRSMSLTNSAGLVPLIRQTTITTATGTFTIGSTGDRDYSAYSLDIQTPNGVTFFAKWDIRAFPNFVPNSNVIVWFDNTTSIPTATYRSIGFITQSTVTANPGTIVLSVLGFAGTIAIFFFCYRHYKMQRLIEMSLESGAFPDAMKGHREMA